jgi:D-amino-acid dehydrogenase
MRIVVMSRLDHRSVDVFVHGNVIHRPDLATRGPTAAAAEIDALRADVLIARAAQAAEIDAIRRALPPARLPHVVVCAVASASRPSDLPADCSLVTAASWQQAEHEAFVLAEALCRPKAESAPHAASGTPRNVVLVGAGVVNLVTALLLRERGHAVTMYDRMADPLQCADSPAHAGASFGGKDARIFSFNESRHHLANSLVPDEAPDGRFRRRIAQDGWLSCAFQSLSEADRRWVRHLEAVPPWAALQYGNDIVRFNQDSDAAWRRLFSLHPELLADAHYVGRLLRVYPSDAALAHAEVAEREIGAVIARLGCDELLAQEPSLAQAVERGALAGALRVRGFSINLHRFARNLIRLLLRLGVRLHWQHRLEDIRRDAAGEVRQLVINGRRIAVRDGVICPGAYGHVIGGGLDGLRSIGAMVGMWVTLPNDGVPLATPLKVRRRGFGSAAAAQGANVVPARDASGRPVLHISSGHGFIGVDARRIDRADLHELARCAQQTAEDLFPDKFRRARDSGLLAEPPAFCVRPWTPSGLGVLEMQPTAAGGCLVFSGGHNTGGFAQSPAVADAVACALEGRPHAMHTLYHPRRFADVFGEAA